MGQAERLVKRPSLATRVLKSGAAVAEGTGKLVRGVDAAPGTYRISYMRFGIRFRVSVWSRVRPRGACRVRVRAPCSRCDTC